MNASKLIEILSKIPPTTKIYIPFHEGGGVDDIEEASLYVIERYRNRDREKGEHQPIMEMHNCVIEDENGVKTSLLECVNPQEPCEIGLILDF